MKLTSYIFLAGFFVSCLLFCGCEGTRDTSIVSDSISNDLVFPPRVRPFDSIETDRAMQSVSNRFVSSDILPIQSTIATMPVAAVTVPIIAYHHINPSIDSDMNVTPTAFRTHMQFLKDNGYTPITLDDWYNAVRKRTDLPAKAVVITFDDGWQDQLKYAVPILEEFNFPATFFIYTTTIGSPESMTWDEVKRLHVRGYEIGSHSIMHSNLIKPYTSENTELFARRQAREIEESKKIIEEKVGCTIRHFCYPYGFYNSDILSLLKDAGYHTAVTVNPSPNDATTSPYLLGRYIIAPWTTLADFSEKLTTRRLRSQKIWPKDAGMYSESIPAVHFTAAENGVTFTRMRMKWKWKWSEAAYSPASSTIVRQSPGGSLSDGAYTVQVHAWDTESNHYTYAWLFQKVDKNSVSVTTSTILAPGYPPQEAL